jgi:hypothetical protein
MTRVGRGRVIAGKDVEAALRSMNVTSDLEFSRQPDAKKVTFTVTPTYRANAPLRSSGLIGPVQLMTVRSR